MRIITAVLTDGLISPSEPIPESAIYTLCDDINYVVYEDGDELPAELISE